MLACALIALVVLALREIYYSGIIWGDFTRSVEGTTFIATPSPFLWGSVGGMLVGYILEMRYRKFLESQIKKIQDDFEEKVSFKVLEIIDSLTPENY